MWFDELGVFIFVENVVKANNKTKYYYKCSSFTLIPRVNRKYTKKDVPKHELFFKKALNYTDLNCIVYMCNEY